MPSIEQNLTKWNEQWDWTRLGEEWTPDENWRMEIVTNGILRFLEPGMDVLEIGPGGGRWTEHLLGRQPHSLLGVDLSPKCVELCRERFGQYLQARFEANDGRSLSMVEDASIDYAWSFDVFVHMDAPTIHAYLAELKRVMRPGAVAVIHYPSIDRACLEDKYHGWREHYTSQQMRSEIETLGFRLLHDHFDQNISSGNSSIAVFAK